jgi:hypothetical protein
MEHVAMSPEKSQALMNFTQNTIYVMGASFILGSLFTLFLLLVLDFVRRNKTDADNQ